MAADLDLGPEAADDALVVDQHGRALDAHVFAAIHALLHPDAVFLADLPALVRGEGEGQRIFLLELVMRAHRISGDADDRRFRLREIGHGVAKPASLGGTARRVVLRIQIDDDRLAALTLETNSP